MRRIKFIALMYFYFLFLLWLGGFIIFQQYIRKRPIDHTTKTDAIVVLTGGKNRIVEAITLYNQGLSDLIFISGVGEKVDSHSLESQNHIKFERIQGKILLGHEATNTIENAVEVSEIIRRHNLKSIRLVTSYYHMPRSLNELRAMVPEIEVIEHPVYSPNVSKRWWKRPKSFYLIASEYHKFMFVYMKNLILGYNKGN